MEQLPKKPLQPRQVRVHVKAFALNYFDILQCRGTYQEKPSLPFTPGAEVAGVVSEVGEGVSLREGDKVVATPPLPDGGYATEVVVDDQNVYPIPDSMSFPDAAAYFIVYQSAYYGLKFRAQLQPGETVLIHAAAGGIGSAAVQIAKALGATVIATAGSDDKVDICKTLGADHVLNYRDDDFVAAVKAMTGGRGADVVFDPVGGEVFSKSQKCIAFDGRLLPIGFAGGDIPQVSMGHVLIKNYSIVGAHFGYFKRLHPERVTHMHRALMRMYEQRLIKPLIFRTYAFEEVVDGLTMLMNRQTFGKLIVGL